MTRVTATQYLKMQTWTQNLFIVAQLVGEADFVGGQCVIQKCDQICNCQLEGRIDI